MAPRGGLPIRAQLEAECERQLAGVGDPELGEWHEWSGLAYHIRRRLTEAEQARVGPVMDIRRTPEAIRRAISVGSMLRLAPAEVLAEELGPVNLT